MAHRVLELTFVRLKLAMLGNAWRGSPTRLFGLAVALGVGALVTVAATMTLAGLGERTTADAEAVAVGLGSVVLVAAFVLPLVFAADDRMDPRAFASLGLRPARVAQGLGLASLVGVPALMALTVAIGAAVGWSDHPGAWGYAVVAVPLIAITAALAVRVSTTLAAVALSRRRERELTALIAFAAAAIVSPLAVLAAFSDRGGIPFGVLRTVADGLGVTPFGFLWAAPADAAAGELGSATGKLVSGIAFAVVLAFVWWVLVRLSFETPARPGTDRFRVGLGWFRSIPSTPAGAIAARSLSYWGRDPRYRVSLAIIPFVPILIVGILAVPGVPVVQLALLPVPVMCFFIGWAIPHNDLAFDHTAVWAHIASDVRGQADRIGRIIPPLMLGVLVIALGTPLTVWASGDWGMLPAVVGVSLCVLLVTLGVSSVMSVLKPYPATHPGSNAFTHPEGADSGSFTAQVASILVSALFIAPTVWFGVQAMLHSGDWAARTFGVGVGTGAIVLVAGVALGGAIYERRAPELLAFTMRS